MQTEAKRPVSSLADQDRASRNRRRTSLSRNNIALLMSGQTSQPLSLSELDASMTLLDSVYDEFRLDCKARRLSKKTVDFYDQRWQKTKEILACLGITIIQAVTRRIVRELMIELYSCGYSQHSSYDTMVFFRVYLNFAVREGFISESPMTNVKMPKLDKRILPAFSQNDIRNLKAGCKIPRDRAFILTLLDTGIRVSEFVALDISDIDFDNYKVMVHRGKGGKGRTVFFGEVTAAALQEYLLTREKLSPDAPLCVSLTTGQRLTDNGLRQMLRRLGRQTGINGCSPHKFRRTFALMCLKKGMNIHALARIMGHSDISVLRQYLPFVDNDLQEAHRLHGPVDHFLSPFEKGVAS